jgi:hypothetical protein
LIYVFCLCECHTIIRFTEKPQRFRKTRRILLCILLLKKPVRTVHWFHYFTTLSILLTLRIDPKCTTWVTFQSSQHKTSSNRFPSVLEMGLLTRPALDTMRCLLLYHITSKSTNTVFLYSSRDDIRIVSLWLSCFGRCQDKTLALLTRRAETRGFASSFRPFMPHYSPSNSPTSRCETYSSLCEIKSVTPLYRSKRGSQVGSQHTYMYGGAALRCAFSWWQKSSTMSPPFLLPSLYDIFDLVER